MIPEKAKCGVVSLVCYLECCGSCWYMKWRSQGLSYAANNECILQEVDWWPRMVSDTALFLPLMSIVKELIEAGRMRLIMMMREPGDTTVAQTRPPIRTGRKWKVEKSANEAFSQATNVTGMRVKL